MPPDGYMIWNYPTSESILLLLDLWTSLLFLIGFGSFTGFMINCFSCIIYCPLNRFGGHRFNTDSISRFARDDASHVLILKLNLTRINPEGIHCPEGTMESRFNFNQSLLYRFQDTLHLSQAKRVLKTTFNVYWHNLLEEPDYRKGGSPCLLLSSASLWRSFPDANRTTFRECGGCSVAVPPSWRKCLTTMPSWVVGVNDCPNPIW